MSENTQVAEKKSFTTSLSEWSNEITALIARDYVSCGVEFDEYSKQCAMEAMSSIYTLVRTNPKINMSNLDTSNLRGIVERCASLKLNANAYPRECYFQLRNVNVGKDANGNDIWQQMIEMGIEGAGNDAILSHFGKGVKRVYPYWDVKEGDEYTPPRHKGIEVTPPEWNPKGESQKTVTVVYPVMLEDGTVTYLIAHRDSVKTNLLAHVKQNLMNETFGLITGTKKDKYGKTVARTRYDATEEEKTSIKNKKEEILSVLRNCATVDEMLSCEIARPYMSMAWLDTPESMITRKMCNNATKKFPKDYNSMANKSFMELDDTYKHVAVEIEENANTVDFDEVAYEVTGEEKPEFE